MDTHTHIVNNCNLFNAQIKIKRRDHPNKTINWLNTNLSLCRYVYSLKFKFKFKIKNIKTIL